MLPVTLLLSSVVGSIPLQPALSEANAQPPQYSLATPKPSQTPAEDISVLWVILDEAPLFPLLTTSGKINSRRFPGFAQLAENSTWYRNVVGTAQRTTEAVPSILTGNWPSYKKYPYLKDHPNNVFTLMSGKKTLDVYQSVTSLCPEDVCANHKKGEAKPPDTQVRILRNMITRSVESTEASLHLAHVLLPHRPWLLAPDLRLSEKMGSDTRRGTVLDRRRDVYQSLLQQYVATDVIIGELVAKLKASQNWDRTMIIVTADHGITFTPGESIRDRINPSNKGTLEDIYRVPLFIKYPDQNSSATSDCTASSIDLLATVIAATGITPEWTTEGSDLQNACPVRKSRTIWWPYSQTKISTSFSAVIKRAKYYDKWIDANGDVDDIYRVGRSGKLVGTSTPDNFETDSKTTWTLDQTSIFKKVTMGQLAKVPTRASGNIVIKGNRCPKCEGLIAINDEFVGVIAEMSDLSKYSANTQYSSSLMSRLIVSGTNKIELWVADWSTSPAQLRRVGPPSKTIEKAGR